MNEAQLNLVTEIVIAIRTAKDAALAEAAVIPLLKRFAEEELEEARQREIDLLQEEETRKRHSPF